MYLFDDNDDDDGGPVSAALYYWGGHRIPRSNNDDDDDANDKTHSRGGSGDDPFDPTAATRKRGSSSSSEKVARRQPPWRRRRWKDGRASRARLLFRLDDDDDDESHWRSSPHRIPDLAPSDEGEDDSSEETEAVDPKAEEETESKESRPSSTGDFDSIPVVDLSLPPAVYARAVGNACRTAGFFYVVNHGVPDGVVETLWNRSKRMFDLPLEEKVAWKGTGARGGLRGYFGLGAEDLENKDGTRDLSAEEGGQGGRGGATNDEKERKKEEGPAGGDHKEGFDCGRDIMCDGVGGARDDRDRACLDLFGANRWPPDESVEGFRSAALNYQEHVLGLADKLMVAFAVSLNGDDTGGGEDGRESGTAVPPDYFVARSRRPMCTLRLLRYPPSASATGCGAHTDYGLFTVLLQDSAGGLQVRNKANRWIDAPPLAGSFVVNVGDMMSRWTGGAYGSTVHRVRSPGVVNVGGGGGGRGSCGGALSSGGGGATRGRSRYSVPFFFNPDCDATVGPIAGNGGDGRQGKEVREGNFGAAGNETVPTALDILAARYEGTFQAKASDVNKNR